MILRQNNQVRFDLGVFEGQPQAGEVRRAREGSGKHQEEEELRLHHQSGVSALGKQGRRAGGMGEWGLEWEGDSLEIGSHGPFALLIA